MMMKLKAQDNFITHTNSLRSHVQPATVQTLPATLEEEGAELLTSSSSSEILFPHSQHSTYPNAPHTNIQTSRKTT